MIANKKPISLHLGPYMLPLLPYSVNLKPYAALFHFFNKLKIFSFVFRMALSKPTSDEDRTRFFRLTLVIIEELTPMLQDFLCREVCPSQILNKVKQDLKHLQPHQIVKVQNAKTEGYKEFDITLLYALLRNYCPNIEKPTQRWGIPSMPGHGEKTEGDDIERIRLIKNEQLSHKSSLAVTEAKYNELWNIISDICSRMQDRLPNAQFVERLEEAENRPIDPEMEKKLLEKFKQLAEEENSIKELLLKLLEKKGKLF